MSLFEGNYDLEISMQLIWEFTIYIENKINFYDEQIANDIFFLPVKERVHDILSSRWSFHTLCCYLFLGSRKIKKKWKWENTKNIYIKKYLKEIQKIIRARKGCWNAEKWPKINWGG
jgi:hypothetical protein